jgi:hypothetical protein
MHDVLHPGKVRVAPRRRAVLPALVLAHSLAAPVAHVERGIGEDEVGLQVGVAVVVEAVAVRDLAVDSADRQVHLREPPCGVVRLLTVDRDVGLGLAAVTVALGMGADKLHRLYEHAGRSTAGVVHPAAVRLEHLDEEVDHAPRRVELAALLALGAREL